MKRLFAIALGALLALAVGAQVTTNPTVTGVISSALSSITASTGTGTTVVLSTSPTLVTPALGAATATSINGNTITTGTGTLTLGAGSTLATSATNSITLTSTGATSVTLPTTGTLATTNGNVATATALASDPADCGANSYASAIVASGNLTCSQPAAANLSNGTTGSGSVVLATGPSITAPTIDTIGFLRCSAGNAVAAAGTITVAVPSNGRGIGFLIASSLLQSNSAIRTQSTSSWFGYDTESSITTITTANGSGGANAFALSYASNTITMTNNAGAASHLNLCVFGGIQNG